MRTRRPSFSVRASPVEQRGEIGIGQERPIEQRGCFVAVGEQAAVVRRHADVLVAFVDGAEQLGAIVGERGAAAAQNRSGVDTLGNFIAQARQPAVAWIPLRQEVAVFRVEGEQQPIKQRQRRIANPRQIGGIEHRGSVAVDAGDRAHEVREHLPEYHAGQGLAW